MCIAAAAHSICTNKIVCWHHSETGLLDAETFFSKYKSQEMRSRNKCATRRVVDDC